MKPSARLLSKILLVCTIPFLFGIHAQAQSPNEIVGRPTDSSVTVSVMFDRDTDFHLTFGRQSGIHTVRARDTFALANLPVEWLQESLLPDTRYFYRTWYRPRNGTQPFTAGPERSFTTKRSRGTSFSFTVEADPHLDSNTYPTAYRATLQHMLSKSPDFMVDLGDNFMTDKMPVINEETITARNLLYRDYWNTLCHSSALFVALGNHEGELGWLPDTGPASLPSLAANIRKVFVPNPLPNRFYSGSSTPSPFVGLRENYYAWEWGDALFVVIDPYIHTRTKPGWGWTLGKEQYDWLKSTLRNSNARFKFIFSHQIVGGSGTEGRGGTEFAHLYEMGGRNTDSTWGFTTQRPGWDKPIHQLMVETGVNVFFHGHDHFYGRQVLDGVVYQEVPQPSAKNLNTVTGLAYGYAEGILLPSRGYILATVDADSVKIDYVRTYLPNEENALRRNGDIAYTYTIRKSTVTGLPVISAVDPVTVHPNPASESIFIRFNGLPPTRYEVRIMDLQGRLLQQSRGLRLSTAQYPDGAYIVQVHTGDYVLNRRVWIRH
jgi:hypothetical protein